MSNSTTADGEYHCTLENSCTTFISIGTFFSLLFVCACGALLYRYKSVCAVGLQEEVLENRTQEPKPIIVQNPITVVTLDEDPC